MFIVFVWFVLNCVCVYVCVSDCCCIVLCGFLLLCDDVDVVARVYCWMVLIVFVFVFFFVVLCCVCVEDFIECFFDIVVEG